MTALIVKDFGFWSVALVTAPTLGREAEHLSRVGAHFWWEYHDKSYPPKPHPQTYGGAFWCFPVLTEDLPELHARLANKPLN